MDAGDVGLVGEGVVDGGVAIDVLLVAVSWVTSGGVLSTTTKVTDVVVEFPRLSVTVMVRVCVPSGTL